MKKYAKQFYIVIIIVCLVVIGLSSYFTLGGFDEVEVFVSGAKARTVVGKEYIEPYDFTTFDQKMRETRAEIDSGKLKGMLTVILYENDTIGQDSIHYFLGASTDDVTDMLRIPAAYDYRDFVTPKVFKVFLSQHPLVRPSPDEINERMQVKSIEEGVVLQPYSFELYYDDETLSVEKWAQ